MINRQPDMVVVTEAGNGRQAIELFRRHKPDITFMDLRMPGVSGVQATHTICQEFPDSRIIVLTTYDGDEDVYRALHVGAKAYLLKDIYREELLEAIRAVHAGKCQVSPTKSSLSNES